MKGPLNPELKIDDVIMLLHMEGETSVPPGTIGVVTKITRDPFEEDGSNIISVKWENGSVLNLITSTDAWKKVKNDTIKEQRDSAWEYMTKNADVFENFDWRWLEKFLYKLRDSGIINMFGAHPLIYSGKEHIDRYYGEGREDDESFQALLDDADEAKDKIIQGVISYMEKNNKSLDNMDEVNRLARDFSKKILGLYIALSGIRHQN
jgi:hypothetical protein